MDFNDFREHEFKIIGGEDEKLQKILNRWRHIYELNILSVNVDTDGNLVVLLARRKVWLEIEQSGG